MQACNPSAGPAAMQREGPGPVPGLFPSRWKPTCDKRGPDPGGPALPHLRKTARSPIFTDPAGCLEASTIRGG